MRSGGGTIPKAAKRGDRRGTRGDRRGRPPVGDEQRVDEVLELQLDRRCVVGRADRSSGGGAWPPSRLPRRRALCRGRRSGSAPRRASTTSRAGLAAPRRRRPRRAGAAPRTRGRAATCHWARVERAAERAPAHSGCRLAELLGEREDRRSLQLHRVNATDGMRPRRRLCRSTVSTSGPTEKTDSRATMSANASWKAAWSRETRLDQVRPEAVEDRVRDLVGDDVVREARVDRLVRELEIAEEDAPVVTRIVGVRLREGVRDEKELVAPNAQASRRPSAELERGQRARRDCVDVLGMEVEVADELRTVLPGKAGRCSSTAAPTIRRRGRAGRPAAAASHGPRRSRRRGTAGRAAQARAGRPGHRLGRRRSCRRHP